MSYQLVEDLQKKGCSQEAVTVNHLYPYAEQLAVSGSSAGPAFAQDSGLGWAGLGDGFGYACGAGVHGAEDGYRSKKSCSWAGWACIRTGARKADSTGRRNTGLLTGF